MDILITVFLPLALAIIMFSLGIGLGIEDFRRVATQPKAFAVGALTQIFIIPVVGFAIAKAFGLPPELALGLMILSFCPSGVTSNYLTKVARGDVALAVSLTGVSSLTAVLTMPILVKFAAEHFLGQAAPAIDVTALGLSMFLITAIPVMLGLAIRHFSPGFAARADKPLSMLATVLFVVVVIGALASNWTIFKENLPVLGPSLVALNVALLALGLVLAAIFSLTRAEATTISVETGIHNATLGITVGTLIVEGASGLPPFSLPSGIYGITMYVVSLPFVFWRRRGG